MRISEVVETGSIALEDVGGVLVMVPLKTLARAHARRLRARAAITPPDAVDRILAACAAHFDVSIKDVRSPGRSADLVRPRHIAMFLARELSDYSMPVIARRFNRDDHTTVLHAVRKIKALSAADAGLRAELDLLRALIAQGGVGA